MPLKFNPLLRGGFDESKRILNDLEDVSTAGTTDGLVLTWEQSSGTWKPAVAGAGDMLKSDYVTGQGTVYNASRLEGETLATVQAHGVDAGTITQGTIGLARVPVMDDAHIPNLETLSYGGTFAEGQIPNLPTSKIISGTFNALRIPTLPNLIGTLTDPKIPDVETLSYGGAFATTQIPNLPTSKITSGTLDVARHETLNNLNGTVDLVQIPTMDDGHIPNLDGLSYGAAFATTQIPNLPTSKITSGSLAVARVAVMDDAHIPDLEGLSYGAAFATTQIPNLPTSKITSGTLGIARVPVMDDAHIPSLETLTGGAFATAQIPAIGAYKISSGTLGAARIPVLPTDRYGSAVLVSGTRSMTGDLDFAKHQAKAMALEVLGSAPASPATAQMYYNTGDDKVYVYVA